jgi:transcriptional regulator with XRE-family HTH domain
LGLAAPEVQNKSIDMQSIGERIHLMRLHIGWSIEECAYRITIEANDHTTPETWQIWERSSDEQATTNGLVQHLEAIARLFATNPVWLRDGDDGVCGQTMGASEHADVLAFPKTDD